MTTTTEKIRNRTGKGRWRGGNTPHTQRTSRKIKRQKILPVMKTGEKRVEGGDKGETRKKKLEGHGAKGAQKT